VLKYAVEYGEGLVTGVKNAVLGVFISVYVLISKERLQAQFRKICAAMLPDNKNRRFERYLLLTHRTFSSFFVGKLINAFIIMLLNFFAMLVLGLEYPLLISVIVGVTDIIPIFGPIIGAIPSFFILFIVDTRQALIFVIMVIIIQQIDGNIIGPKILGESTGISSLGVIVAIIVMGEYFGIIGMLVGVPVFAVATTIFKEYFETRLKKRGKATDTAEYYMQDSIVDPHERHVPVGQRMFNNITRTFAKVGKLIFRKKQKTDDGEGQETTHQTKENENGEQS
jgi:predicted PurR-regulated permease PerM